MKKLLLAVVLMFSLNIFAQVSEGVSTVGGYYGSSNNTSSLGLDVTFNVKNTDFIVGFGGSLNLQSEGGGDNDNRGYYSAFYSTDYIGTSYNYENFSYYALLGYDLGRVRLIGKIGDGRKADYNNYYDRYRILGDRGYYFTSSDSGGELIYGGSIDIKVLKKVYASLGYDTFNGTTIGVNFKI